tara:strand:+ start:54 stop:353 length:300 start_codon:yes stop_codon:yes gene_type:complete
METNKILELVKKAEDKVNSTMLSNIRKTEINLILLEIQKEAINYSQCCTQLKEKYTPHFGEWLEAEGYDYVKNSVYKKVNMTFNKLELVRMYNEYLQSL